jgi:hypothetical protein
VGFRWRIAAWRLGSLNPGKLKSWGAGEAEVRFARRLLLRSVHVPGKLTHQRHSHGGFALLAFLSLLEPVYEGWRKKQEDHAYAQQVTFYRIEIIQHLAPVEFENTPSKIDI